MNWLPIETAPHDRLVIVYCPPREGLNEIVCLCQWHDSCGFCVDEIRYVTHWRPYESPVNV